ANSCAPPTGGPHLPGGEQGLRRTVRQRVGGAARKLKAGRDRVEKDAARAGLTAVLNVRLVEPQFEGQTKEILGTPAARQIGSKVVSQQLEKSLSSTARAQKQQAGQVPEKVVAAVKSRIRGRGHQAT
ncbi:DNA topoisomerase IV subunit B, partial [Rothia kristinae]